MEGTGNYKLTNILEKHEKILLSWRNSDHVSKYMFSESVITEEAHHRWFQNLIKGSGIIGKVLLFNEKPIGFVNFSNIEPKHNKCHWGFYIGEGDAPRGSGTIMGLLALSCIFEEYLLRKLCTEVLDFNNISINYHQKLGFVEEGRLKKHIYKNNSFHDVIVMALFNEDWSRNKEQKFIEWREKYGGANNY
ncbi:UDP-4-amino-4,6-dideoxy-N-acetyl-beta-L-altrosamine N-acetyltransferase [Desulforamulus aquiferis]|uniref:UDP-4-amino-4, 6-dideoxy-N-acetyl-beta-L-altrosamine N-acetyltransferase n=1 Tax=Desulforamulus aquiferis TaxID=1397668 RepID=A0AAW7ZGB6_9FIRM|nr:UDP-4-amino-4,6-dideoxy-N-acetyl-beta-L-altrosamine N-acetyltransferase [Desulforamulus aquiferis]MDO7788275.1 UDP-4-amino-4,6-dideoxy-N-acetyl-beta-L-altrosamine N-acetyltransferase [Desulforamulus aquiferis]RYD03461.1 hypothetical protein N752_19980 [Desulforamulus aquiferis]